MVRSRGAKDLDKISSLTTTEFWDRTNKQGWHVYKLSQLGIASCAYEPGPYSSRESIPAGCGEYFCARCANAQKKTWHAKELR